MGNARFLFQDAEKEISCLPKPENFRLRFVQRNLRGARDRPPIRRDVALRDVALHMKVGILRRHFQLVRGPAFSSQCPPLEGGAPERENGPRATRAIERKQARKGLFSFVPMPSKKKSGTS
jgi:hypothetical protein